MIDVRPLLWPAADAKAAVQTLAAKSGLGDAFDGASQIAVDDVADPARFAEQLRMTGALARVSIDSNETSWPELSAVLMRSAPCIVRVEGGSEPAVLVVLAATRRAITVLTPTHAAVHVEADALCAALPASDHEALTFDAVLGDAGVSVGARARAAQIVREHAQSDTRVTLWSLRSGLEKPLLRHLADARITRQALGFFAAYALYYVAWIASWWIIGRTVLIGRIDQGWLTAWLLCLLTLVPLHMLVTWQQGTVATLVGGVLRAKLLHSMLRLRVDHVRSRGIGELLGRVLDVQTFETLALGGGLGVSLGALELCITLALLFAAPQGAIPAVLLAVWLCVTAVLGFRYFDARTAWTQARTALTFRLVENMVGHRTRLAQERASERYKDDDRCLAAYERESRRLDLWQRMLTTLPARGWMLVGVAGLGPSFIGGSANPTTLAVGLGLILLAYRAFYRLSFGASDLAGAWVAARGLDELLSNEELAHRGVALALPGAPPSDAAPALEAREVGFAYAGAPRQTLTDCTLRIGPRDRVVLSGDSGGGKSTLAALVAGLRSATTGTLLVGGLDRATLGDSEWRRRIALAPQFHENHVLAGTFAYNLLLGREWPPSKRDLDEAEAVCRDLGLGGLLARMPSGLFQMVGETGWQLSHGERSRLFLARTLLQRPDLVILDESFAALDPETFEQCVRTASERARALLVVAHA